MPLHWLTLRFRFVVVSPWLVTSHNTILSINCSPCFRYRSNSCPHTSNLLCFSSTVNRRGTHQAQILEYPRSLMTLWTDPWLIPITSMISFVVTRLSLRISSSTRCFVCFCHGGWGPARTWLVYNVTSATLKVSYPSPNASKTKC